MCHVLMPLAYVYTDGRKNWYDGVTAGVHATHKNVQRLQGREEERPMAHVWTHYYVAIIPRAPELRNNAATLKMDSL